MSCSKFKTYHYPNQKIHKLYPLSLLKKEKEKKNRQSIDSRHYFL